MADYRLSLGIDEYALYITNQDNEDELEPNQISSASEFSVIFNPSIDLNALLYLKAVQAQIACQDFCIDGLPLTLTRTETFTIFLEIEPQIGDMNLNLNSNKVEKKNKVPMTLPIPDLSTSDPKLLIDTINKVFENDVNHFIFYRYLIAFFDCNIFNTNYVVSPSEQDMELIEHYTNFVLFSRYIVHQTLCKHIDLVEDITQMIQITSTKKKPLSLTVERETNIISASDLLRPLESRKGVTVDNFIDLSLFY